MATKVGMQSDLVRALQDLIELDYDAVEAYEAAINRIDNGEYKAKLNEFKEDHRRHIREIGMVLKNHNQDVPSGPSLGKQWLTKGKVVLGNIVGDSGIISAMRSNEIDTNTAYERMVKRSDLWEDIVEILRHGYEDEKRHKAWLDSLPE